MKRLLMIALCSFAIISIYGQSIGYITNAPRCGDVLQRRQVGFFDSGNGGNNVVWDFRDIDTDGEIEQTEFYYGADSLLQSANSSIICRYHLTSDSLMLTGYESPLEYMEYTIPIPLVAYPYSYGYTMTNNYEGRGTYCQQQNIRRRGTLIVEADAAGAIIAAEGDTLRNAIRLHAIRTSSVCMYAQSDTLFADSTNMKQEIQETNQWYVPGYRYPLYETVSTSYYDDMTPVSCIQTAYLYSPEEQGQLDDEENRKILEDIEKEHVAEADIIHYHVSNNGTTLELDYSLDAEANINAIVCNSLGMVYGRQKAHQAEGTDYRLSFDITSLPRGEYVLYINVNDKVYNEKFHVKR